MQIHENCYENVWILSGTSDGPILAEKLIELKYTVFASVVTYKASKSYSSNSQLHIITGKLNDKSEITSFLKKNKIKFVVDATHAFAQVISKNLNKACRENNVPLFVYERKSLFKKSNKFKYISSLKDIKCVDIENKNILLAIGSRLLDDTAYYYLKYGANVFARVLPTSDSISKAFGSCIKKSNIAILEPSRKKNIILEKKLCDFWEIDYVLCRESGSYSQRNWERIISDSQMKLFLVKRPKLESDNSPYFFSEYSSLIDHLANEF